MNKQAIRLGELLVENGALSPQQVYEITVRQQHDPKPFGVLAEEMFEVTLDSIEQAWSEQYLRQTGLIDLKHEKFPSDATSIIGRRQAWQFQMIPVRFDGEGELLIAAARGRLARAVTFVHKRLTVNPYFRIASDRQIEKYLNKLYPLACMKGRTWRDVRGLAQAA